MDPTPDELRARIQELEHEVAELRASRARLCATIATLHSVVKRTTTAWRARWLLHWLYKLWSTLAKVTRLTKLLGRLRPAITSARTLGAVPSSAKAAAASVTTVLTPSATATFLGVSVPALAAVTAGVMITGVVAALSWPALSSNPSQRAVDTVSGSKRGVGSTWRDAGTYQGTLDAPIPDAQVPDAQVPDAASDAGESSQDAQTADAAVDAAVDASIPDARKRRRRRKKVDAARPIATDAAVPDANLPDARIPEVIDARAPGTRPDARGAATVPDAAPARRVEAKTPAEARTLALAIEALRQDGTATIIPSTKTKQAMRRDARERIIGRYRLCMDRAGWVTEVTTLVSSGYSDYDAKVLAAAGKWRYRPYKQNGDRVAVCWPLKIVYRQKLR